MTANRNLKRRVRARAAKTGESYTAALRHFRPTPMGETMPDATRIRLAAAQITVPEDPRDSTALRRSGLDIRRLMHEAHRLGARIVHFPEGATCSPNKLVMSVNGPDQVGPSDWDRFDWDTLRQELTATAQLARDLKLWTVLGSVHRLTPPHRPHNSLYVISDQGQVTTRYDERLLSYTKISYMYAPGCAPVTFEVDGVRFGCALGIEVHFPEVFSVYERLDVDCVLFSTTGPPIPESSATFATEAQGHAAINSYWVSLAMSTQHGSPASSGIIAPDGAWLARCPADGKAAVAVANIDNSSDTIDVAVTRARPWRRKARGDAYEPHRVHDQRSDDRQNF
jgi:predicted amidohydrolase